MRVMGVMGVEKVLICVCHQSSMTTTHMLRWWRKLNVLWSSQTDDPLSVQSHYIPECDQCLWPSCCWWELKSDLHRRYRSHSSHTTQSRVRVWLSKYELSLSHSDPGSFQPPEFVQRMNRVVPMWPAKWPNAAFSAVNPVRSNMLHSFLTVWSGNHRNAKQYLSLSPFFLTTSLYLTWEECLKCPSHLSCFPLRKQYLCHIKRKQVH